MSTWNAALRFGLVIALVPLLSGGGCVVTVDPLDGGGGNGGGGGGGDGTGTVITVRIINASNVTLDPEIYISAEPVTVEQLFQPGNKYTAFGVGTLGLLGSAGTDQFTIECANARVIGTSGGKFGDNLNEPEGTGRQIVLTQDLSIFCEGRVTFTYSRSGGGFTTTFDVDP
jgi:hypothetical protein